MSKTFYWMALLIGILSSKGIFAAPDYVSLVKELEQRLTTTGQLYRSGQIEAAKQAVQMAYFEVFENLEGPIRVNFSAQKSYQLESTFGEIRKMIAAGAPLDEVDQRITWLKGQLAALPDVLAQGHQLTAEGTLITDKTVEPFWQQQLMQIDDGLAEALFSYRTGDRQRAVTLIRQAQYDGYKNTEMEIAIRQQISAQAAADINLAFQQLMQLAGQPDQLQEIGYRIPILLQDIGDRLPGLAVTRPEQQQAPDEVAEVDWATVARDIQAAVGAALRLYDEGKRQEAMMALQNSYFDLFESSGMEAGIGARDIDLKTTLEGHFTRLVSLMKAGRPGSELDQEAALLTADLAQAVKKLGEHGGQGFIALLLYSLTIILREGLEALLVVTAIVAYLVKNQHADKLPVIRNSVVVAVLASLVTAAVFQWLLVNAGTGREILEGVTLLIAVGVLFFTSYWLIAKVEAERWKAYLDGKLTHSLGTGSLIGLWMASFLAVYREGAETALFYYALLVGTDATGALAVLTGFVIGCALLVIVYLLMRHSVIRLPIRAFFLVTGSFLYLMAFVFAGRGMLELIEGQLFQPTLLAGMPTLSVLGIYPYLETLLPQFVLVIAALTAWWLMKRGHSSVARATVASSSLNDPRRSEV